MSQRIAVIGSGISGLTCAHVLSVKHQVTVFEANDYIGGHTATVDIPYDGQTYAVDTGFIVFNDRTYPRFQKLLSHLGVQPKPTQMSFSVHNPHTGLEYNGHTLASLFAQKRNLFRPQFWGFLREILRFNQSCQAIYQSQHYPKQTLGEYLIRHKFSPYFAEHYILPMGAAIWSASIEEIKEFDLRFFIQFFEHHGLFNIKDRPQWYVLEGGSRTYIPELIKPFADSIHLNTPIISVTRQHNKVQLTTAQQQVHEFDQVIFACHSDQALAMLKDANAEEQKILSALPYQNNEVVLHTDISLLPDRPAAWASWNYRLTGDPHQPATVTYNMNILQQFSQDAPTFCVTLNQTQAIDPEKIIRKFVYAHPLFSQQSMAAQQQRNLISGHHNTHFAGAYWHNGFHEDGVRSALDVCEFFNLTLDDLAHRAA